MKENYLYIKQLHAKLKELELGKTASFIDQSHLDETLNSSFDKTQPLAESYQHVSSAQKVEATTFEYGERLSQLAEFQQKIGAIEHNDELSVQTHQLLQDSTKIVFNFGYFHHLLDRINKDLDEIGHLQKYVIPHHINQANNRLDTRSSMLGSMLGTMDTGEKDIKLVSDYLKRLEKTVMDIQTLLNGVDPQIQERVRVLIAPVNKQYEDYTKRNKELLQEIASLKPKIAGAQSHYNFFKKNKADQERTKAKEQYPAILERLKALEKKGWTEFKSVDDLQKVGGDFRWVIQAPEIDFVLSALDKNSEEYKTIDPLYRQVKKTVLIYKNELLEKEEKMRSPNLR